MGDTAAEVAVDLRVYLFIGVCPEDSLVLVAQVNRNRHPDEENE